MRRLARSSRGLSEIVGTLMLILIVVSAATVLSVFIATYQKQLQTEQALNQQRSLESLRILGVVPTANLTTPAKWTSLNFTVVSLYINPSTLDSVWLNGIPVHSYTAWSLNLSSGKTESAVVGAGGYLNLYPREEVYLNLTTAPGSNSSFYNNATVFPTTDYLQLTVNTALLNSFQQVFIPPTAIGLVTGLEGLSGGIPATIDVLNGGSSFQPGNGSIDAWSWNVTDVTHPLVPCPNAAGEEVAYNFPGSPGDTYLVKLEVTDNNGLFGADSFTFVGP